MNVQDPERPVLFFDGECNLCNSTVQFVIRHDRKKQFLFAPLQSEAGKHMLKELLASVGEDTFLLFYRGKYYVRSGAALRVCKLLGSLWSLLYAAIIIPRFIRDAVYDFISRNRYKWFGKSAECMLPTPELKERFLTA